MKREDAGVGSGVPLECTKYPETQRLGWSCCGDIGSNAMLWATRILMLRQLWRRSRKKIDQGSEKGVNVLLLVKSGPLKAEKNMGWPANGIGETGPMAMNGNCFESAFIADCGSRKLR